jgi:hypothetical protein
VFERFILPVFVILGLKTSPRRQSRARVRRFDLRAGKGFVSIESGGHFLVFMKSGAFVARLVSRGRPPAA